MWLGLSLVVYAVFQTAYRLNEHRIQTTMQQILPKIEAQADLYGRLWGRMLISRQMFIDFASMEGFQYPDEFLLLVEEIDRERESPLAIRYRTLMKEVMGPIQQECLDLIMNKKWLFTSEGELSEFLLEYMLMASSYKIIFSRWDTGNFDVHFSSRRFPPELIDHLQTEYYDAKRKVEDLMSSLSRRPTFREGWFMFKPSDSSSSSPTGKDAEKTRRRRFSSNPKSTTTTIQPRSTSTSFH